MALKLSGWDDTIVALATPPGVGAIGVIRVSGKETFPIINKLFPSKDLSAQPSHTLHVGYLLSGDETIDEVVVSLFRAPRSYTGEDVIEIACHGSPYVQQQVIGVITANGARLAKPGEFTQRAFLNGKMDLAQAEAVADIISSSTKASRDTALHAMRGGFSSVLGGLREQMIKFSALIELELDFSQEDVEFADRTQFYALLRDAADVTARLLESFKYGNVIKNGVRVAIVGKPNAGKSTLLNALLNENRAIVSDIAGTTRDTIEEVLNIDGILFRLIDTAGLRSHTADIIERAGMEKTLQKIAEADVVIYVFDVGEMDAVSVYGAVRTYDEGKLILVGNKVDVGTGDEGLNVDRRLEITDDWEKADDDHLKIEGKQLKVVGEQGKIEDHHLKTSNEHEKTADDRPNTEGEQGTVVGDHLKIPGDQGKIDRLKTVDDHLKMAGQHALKIISFYKESGRRVPEIILMSAKRGDGLEPLKRAMYGKAISGSISPDETIITNARHLDALVHVQKSLHDILIGLEAGVPSDLIALDIRQCLHYLGEITGEVTNEEQWTWIFSKFCIGK